MLLPSHATVFRTLAIAVAICVCGAFTPSRAVAGCGDYNMPDHPPEIGRHLNAPEKSPAVPICRGPHCRQAPFVPAPLREAPARLILAEKVISNELPPYRQFIESTMLRFEDQDDLAAIHFSRVIFHPPR